MFKKMQIPGKLWLAFMAVVATIMVMIAVIFWNLLRLEHAVEAKTKSSHSIDLMTQAQFKLSRQENSFRGFLLSGDPYYLERVSSHRAGFDDLLAEAERSQAGHEDEAAQLAKLGEIRKAMTAWQKNVVEVGARLAGDPATRSQAVSMVGQNGIADDYMAPVEDGITAMIASERAEEVEALAAREAATSMTFWALYVGLGLAVAIAGVLGFVLARSIAAPVAALTATMARLASGDNTVDVPATERGDEIGAMARAVLVFKDAAIAKLRLEEEAARSQAAAEDERLRNEAAREEARAAAEQERAVNEAEKAREAEADHVTITGLATGLAALASGDLTFRITTDFPAKAQRLKDDFNVAIGRLEEALASVMIAAESIRGESNQVTEAADDLSHRTENQAAALEETAASLEELTASVKAAAAVAEKASVDVATTRQSAEESGRIVRQAVDAMSEIEKSSQHISQIIGVIDDIAFQTNLLALNAGVEAARAGEAGRGFAVVASEVRALAQRSSDAAKEIKALISTSSQQVGRGVDLVGDTGKSLQTIVEAVGGITALIVEIANSSREQSVGLSEINTAVNQLDQVTQQNAAMVEESTAASHAMKSEAESLSHLVGQFKADLARAGSSAAPVVRMPAAPKKAPKPMAGVPRTNGSAALAMKPKNTLDEWQEF